MGFLSNLNKNSVANALNPYIQEHPLIIGQIFTKLNIFAPKQIINLLLENKTFEAISLLSCHKEFYTKEDLSDLQRIADILNNLHDQGSIQYVKKNIFSNKEEQVYICPKGHTNSAESLYCADCNLNIKGLTPEQVNVIGHFISQVEILEEILK